MTKTAVVIVPVENLIMFLRGQRVLLDADLAQMYDVTTSALNQAVKRNRDRFPNDFMFKLTTKEAATMRSQSVTASKRNVGANPYAFTEQGVAMLSSVLRSQRAIHVNIAIMRAFVKMRMVLAKHRTLSEKLTELERKVSGHDADIAALIDAIRQLMTTPDKTTRKIGFK